MDECNDRAKERCHQPSFPFRLHVLGLQGSVLSWTAHLLGPRLQEAVPRLTVTGKAVRPGLADVERVFSTVAARGLHGLLGSCGQVPVSGVTASARPL